MIDKELMNKQERIIEKVAKAYHSILRKNNFFPSYNQELEFYDSMSCVCREHLPSEKFVLAVETSYFGLRHHLRKIIKCEYFYKNFPFWWQPMYSRRQFFRYKQEAMAKFIANLEKTKAITLKGKLNYEKDN